MMAAAALAFTLLLVMMYNTIAHRQRAALAQSA